MSVEEEPGTECEQGALFEIEGPDEDECVWFVFGEGLDSIVVNAGPHRAVAARLADWLSSTAKDMRPNILPHHGVYARLGRSDIHGIGVIAIRDIPAGTNIFANDGIELVWVDEGALEGEGLTSAERELYKDFGIAVGGKIGCPVNFNCLTPGWHCNEAPEGTEPNIAIDKELNFVARRSIISGEELTIRYAELIASQSDT